MLRPSFSDICFLIDRSPPQAVKDCCEEAVSLFLKKKITYANISLKGNGILASLIDFPLTIQVRVTWQVLGANVRILK